MDPLTNTAARHRLLSRRGALSALTLSGLAAAAAGFSPAPAWADATAPADPFTLGVASGDPQPRGIVLWTRLAPEPLALDGCGGMPDRKVPVVWEVAEDERFRTRVRQGMRMAVPELAHSVHIEVDGLRPGREYFYRFRAMGTQSPVGRTRTAPAPGSRLDCVRFGIASCQWWAQGFYTAYRHLAEDDLDVVFHLGDYIYENVIPADGAVRQVALPDEIRTQSWTLTEYRNRHALFRTDADLRAAHAAVPFSMTWDDHEVVNNWAGDHQRGDVPPEEFLERRAAAAQAYYEHLPLRLPQRPDGPNIKLYRRLTYGNLATFHVLDGRTFRDPQGCGDGRHEHCEEAYDPARSMLGFEQEDWLYEGFAQARTTWNVLANQVAMSQVYTDTGYLMDFWDGYVPARDRLFDALRDPREANLVVLTGDMHRNIAGDLKADFDDPDSPNVGVELVGTSITSAGDGEDSDANGERLLELNPHLRFNNRQRGYVRFEATHDTCAAELRVMPYVSEPGAPISTRIRLVTQGGNPGLQVDTENRT